VTFEQGFADAERAASSAGKTVALLAGAVKQLQKASTEGDLYKMRKASDRLVSMLEAARQEVANARSAWPFTMEEEETYLRDSYAAELVEVARQENLPIQQRDEGLLAFPSVLRVLPAAERGVKLNRKKVQALRPSHLVKVLKAIQARKPKGAPEQVLEMLHRAYRMVTKTEFLSNSRK